MIAMSRFIIKTTTASWNNTYIAIEVVFVRAASASKSPSTARIIVKRAERQPATNKVRFRADSKRTSTSL